MDKVFNKVFIGFGVVFAAYQFYAAGLDAHKGFYNDSVFSVLTAIFWIFLVAIMLKLEINRKRDDRHERRLKEAFAPLDRMFDEIKEEQHAREMLEAISRDVIGNRKPKASDAAKIEKAFHENMEDHWARLSFDKKSGKFDVEIQKQPFEVAKPKRVRKAPVKKAPAKKPAVKKAGK